MQQLWEAVRETTGRSGHGLRIAAGITLEQFETFGRVVATSATLGEALARGIRYFRLLSERQRFVLRLSHSVAKVTLETHGDGRLHREGAEFLIGALVKFGWQLAGQKDAPTEVRFMHDAPPHAVEVQQFFGCDVQFGAHEHAVLFDNEVLHWPVRGSDPNVCATLQQEAEALLAELAEPTAFRHDVMDAIYREIDEGRSNIARVASRMGMHPKALARALHADGTSYRELLETVRLHLARHYLEQPRISVTEVAFRLGYSEKSAFNRAFKRWTGEAPERYRHSRSHQRRASASR